MSMAEVLAVRVEGMDEAMAKLKAVAANLPKEADKIIEDGGERIFAMSQQLVPVDTGTLQRSGMHQHEFLRSEISYNTEYAAFVEYGTSRMAAQPYLRPAADATISWLQSELGKLLNE